MSENVLDFELNILCEPRRFWNSKLRKPAYYTEGGLAASISPPTSSSPAGGENAADSSQKHNEAERSNSDSNFGNAPHGGASARSSLSTNAIDSASTNNHGLGVGTTQQEGDAGSIKQELRHPIIRLEYKIGYTLQQVPQQCWDSMGNCHTVLVPQQVPMQYAQAHEVRLQEAYEPDSHYLDSRTQQLLPPEAAKHIFALNNSNDLGQSVLNT